MGKLMSAGLSRLWKDKVFWITAGAMLVFNLVNVFNGIRQAAWEMDEFGYTLDHYCFGFLPMFGTFAGAFISLFLGTEYSDGTLRNKVIIGHTRVKVYFASFLTSYIGSVTLLMTGFLAGMVGAPFLGWMQLEASAILSYLLISLLMAGAWCALFTLIGMLVANKAYSAVFCILFWLGFTFLGSYFYNALFEPETHAGALVTATGIVMGEPTPNPNYIGGFKRQVYEFLSDFFPSSQCIQMSNLEVVHPLRMMLSSLAITATATLCGVLCFRKKDLK